LAPGTRTWHIYGVSRHALAAGLVIGLLAAAGGARLARGSSIDRDLIQRSIRKHSPQIRACYAAAESIPEGRLVVRFVIGASGAVKRAERDPGSTLQVPDIEACVLAEVRRWRFPRMADGSEVTIIYPFNIDWAGP
jgi:hypothetical protein